MSQLIDLTYVGMLASRLERFKTVSSTVWNCKCPFCPGSISNPRKLTFYIYCKQGDVVLYCHACQTPYNMKRFLWQFDENMAREYSKECYLENKGKKTYIRQKTTRKTFLDVSLPSLPKVEKNSLDASNPDYRSILKGTPFVSLLDLPEDHITKQYLRSRLIPESSFGLLAYVPKMSDIFKAYPDYVNLEKSSEERLVVPFVNKSGEIIGATCRALNKNAQRYVEIKFKPDAKMLFGMERVNKNKKVFIFEGAFDSLLIPNAIAINGLAVGKLAEIDIPMENIVLVVDNQCRHNAVVNSIDKFINAGYTVCLMPSKFKGKDLNDMLIKKELDINNACDIILANCYQGLQAKLFFTKWRKV